MNKNRVYGWIDARTFGLIPGVLAEAANNTTKLNAALVPLRRKDKAVYFPPDFHCYFSGRVLIDSVMVFGDKGSKLIFNDGTNRPAVGVFMQGHLPKLKWVDLIVEGATVRSGAECLWIRNNTSGHEIDGVTVQGASGSGIFIDGATCGQIRNSIVRDVLSDGFHNNNGTSYCEITDCLADGTGDDYFAVVSYQSQGKPCRYITIRNIRGQRQSKNGRGITVVGGDNIKYDNFYIKDTVAFGVYVFAESSFNTYGANNISITNGVVDGTGTGAANPSLWTAVLVGEDNGQPIRNVTISGVEVKKSGGSKSRAFGNVAGVNISVT